MPNRIELLKQAGFSDAEIGDWATAERQRMQAAGFTDGEIDEEFGVTRPPRAVPDAFIDRLKQGNWFHRILGAAGEYAQRYFGDEPLGFSQENKETLSKLGVVGDIIVPAAKPVDALLRSVPAGLAGIGAGVGQAAEEGQEAAFGPGPEAKGKAARDFAQFAQVAALLSGANGPRSGAIRASAPNATSGAAIVLPRAEDFRNAAAAISGTPASFRIEQKLLRLWTDHGIPPAEVAGDALRDRTIAEAIRSDSEALPQSYVGTGKPAAASSADASAQPVELAQADHTTIPAGARPEAIETENGPAIEQPAPAPMIAEGKDIAMYNPPRIPQRPFAFDYRAPPQADAEGRLRYDMEGRPLKADFIAGRRYAGGGDQPLSPDDLRAAMDRLKIRYVETPEMPTGKRTLIGQYQGFEFRGRPVGDMYIKSTANQSDKNLIMAHEFSHAIDHFAGILSRRLTDKEIEELRPVYTTLRAGPRKTLYPQPEDFGYGKRAIKLELLAEGLRAYLTNPNYFKAMAPRTAAKIRAAVNESPYLKRVIQFNSLGPIGLVGAGVSGQDQDNQ